LGEWGGVKKQTPVSKEAGVSELHFINKLKSAWRTSVVL
jgi:hypothetical protein